MSVILAVLVAPGASGPVRAGDATEINQLKEQIEQLDQKVKILERKRELERESAAEKSREVPRVSLGANGLSVTSADSNFVFKIRGYVQFDSRFYPDRQSDSVLSDTFLIRRARPIFEGTVYRKLDWRVMLDFGAQSSLSSANNALLQEAYLNARLWEECQIQAGKFKEPVGLERLQSGANLLFVERAYPTQLVPNRDVGAQVQGDLLGSRLNYAVGVFNGVADGGSGDFDTTDDDKDIAGRLFSHPFRHTHIEWLEGVGLGVAGTFGDQSGPMRPFVSAGLQRFFTYRASTAAAQPNVVADGNHWRLSPQAYYYWGPLGLLAEYVISSQEVVQSGGGAGAGERERLAHTGWQVAVSCFATGEADSFRPVVPAKPVTFSRDGGWGALELVARVTQLEVDDGAFPVYADPASSATKATTWSAGANWHLNRNVKLSLQYDHTDFRAAAGNPLAASDEHVILTRIQFSF